MVPPTAVAAAVAASHSSKLNVVCRKTKLCRFYELGMCTKDGDCNFAHGARELQPVPDLSNTKTCHVFATTGHCDRSDCRFAHSRDELRRVRLPAQPEGVPPAAFGDTTCAPDVITRQLSASTAASEQELPLAGVAEDTDGQVVVATAPDEGSTQAAASRIALQQLEAHRGRFRKTKMCTFFLQGECRKAGLCNFAHSLEEMNPLPDLHRTKLCKAVLEGGVCAAQGTCRFAHSEQELRPMAPKAAAGAKQQYAAPNRMRTAFGGELPRVGPSAMAGSPLLTESLAPNSRISLTPPSPWSTPLFEPLLTPFPLGLDSIDQQALDSSEWRIQI